METTNLDHVTPNLTVPEHITTSYSKHFDPLRLFRIYSSEKRVTDSTISLDERVNQLLRTSFSIVRNII